MKLHPRLLNEARQSKVAILLSIFSGLLAGILGIFQARGISRLINQVFLQGKDLGAVSRILITVFIIILLRAGFTWCGELFAGAGARRIKQGLRQRLYAHINDIGPSYLRSEAGESEVRT
jgi:ATP-binding cassette subfamily C protein CydD